MSSTLFYYTKTSIPEKTGVFYDLNEHLEQMGKDGWELVSTCASPGNPNRIYMFWKMQLREYQEMCREEEGE